MELLVLAAAILMFGTAVALILVIQSLATLLTAFLRIAVLVEQLTDGDGE